MEGHYQLHCTGTMTSTFDLAAALISVREKKPYLLAEFLWDAIDARNCEAVALLVTAGADVNAFDCVGNTTLHGALGSRDMVCQLIDAGADINAKSRRGSTVLILAVQRNDLEMVKLLADAGADLTIADSEGNTALSYARGSQSDRGGDEPKPEIEAFLRYAAVNPTHPEQMTLVNIRKALGLKVGLD